MIIEQLYTNCLAEAAYYIESEGEAIIIDPIRETEPYIAKLNERGTKLKYVLETHFHADFVSGHIDLAAKTGAKIIFGPMAETKYKVHNAKDGDELEVGKLKIKVLHTPGHTPESTCYLLHDANGKPHCIFTGDTLFVGDVGRPDLLDGTMSKEELGVMMYNSLTKKIKTLPDDVIVYPAHGPGSACGKNIGKETWSTIGEQKKSNYALQEMTCDEFVDKITTGLAAPPPYFFKDAFINKNGYQNIDEVISNNAKALDVNEFKKQLSAGAFILDTRVADDFEKAFISGSLNIGLNGQFAVWVGTLVDITKPLLLITADGKENETVLRLARVGYENVKGYLKGGISSWVADGNKTDTVTSITAQEVESNFGKMPVLDVRKTSEFDNGHVKNAIHIPLCDLEKKLDKIDKSKTYIMHCAGGYRSMMAASILKARGYTNFVNVYGGYAKIKETKMPVELPVTA
jgi:glyoxylase-like metal-dependent hydrolase (beta-lactamase superfamily II)